MVEALSNIGVIGSEVMRSEVTGRNFYFYGNVFDYSKENLEGKKILDVGAGESGFAEMACRYGAKIINLDGSYLTGRTLFGSKRFQIAGFAQYLPFRDEVFEEAIALYSLYWIKTGLNKALKEMIRVTKSNGKIKIFPTYNIGFTYTLKDEPAIDFLERREASTLVINKEPRYSNERWTKLADKIVSSLAFKELY